MSIFEENLDFLGKNCIVFKRNGKNCFFRILLKEGNLYRESVIVIPKIGIVHSNLIIKEIGILKSEKTLEIIDKLCANLGCNS